ncbi:MAG TPA: BlaI/MecI/CopY family transcriptional regulator [Pyrinomonadaceae bacterium]|nr:BlaI/MecI/CopY family transcriptional regulator [Pyrinomonadaceae bacterium]
MAKKKTNEQITPLEMEIMKVLWEIAPATVQMVQQKLEQGLAYTTVQTMLNVLHRKEKVSRELHDRAYQYSPVVSRHQVVAQTMRDIIDRMFGGSAENLVMSLVEARHLDKKKLVKLQEMIEGAKGEGDGKN